MFTLLCHWLLYHKKWLIFILSANVVENVIEILMPFLLATFIDQVLIPKDLTEIGKYCILFAAFIVVEVTIQFSSAVYSTKLTTNTIAHAVQELLKHLVSYPYDFFRNYQSGYLADRINRDVYDLTMFAINSCILVIAGICTLLGAFSYLIIVDKVYILIFLIMLVAYLAFYHFVKDRLQKLSFATRESESEFFNIIVQVISDIKPIKIHELYSIYANELRRKFEKWYGVNVQREKLSYWFSGSRTIMGRLFILINFAYGGIQVVHGNLAVGQFVAINTYFLLALSGASAFLNLAQNYQSALAAYERINSLQQQKAEANGNIELQSSLEEIEFRNLTYSINNAVIIQSFSHKFYRGKIYCLTGENGAGKTTLFNLLVGLVKPECGNIFYNGKPLYYYDINKLRSDIIGFSDQEAFICEPLVKEQKLNQKLLAKFHLNYDSIKHIDLLDKNLSGGEKQKLTHLQFLSEGAQILLLDEPTAAMDIKDSINLWQYLLQKKEDSIIIVITHKEDELKYADEIIPIKRAK